MGRSRIIKGDRGKITIVQIDHGKWRARTLVRLQDGKRVQIERWAKTKAAADTAVKRGVRERLDSESAKEAHGNSRTLGEVAADWLVELAKDGTKAIRTRQEYSSAVRNHLLGTNLAGMTPRGIRAIDVEDWLNWMIDTKGGPSVQRRCKATLGLIMDRAVREELVADLGAVHAAKPRKESTVGPRPTVVRDHVHMLTADEIERLLEAARADQGAVDKRLPELIVLMLGTGARIGEALALRWQDIDFSVTENGGHYVKATISGTVVRVDPQDDPDGGPRIPGHVMRQPKPKSTGKKNKRAQTRTTPVTRDAADMLQELRGTADGVIGPIFPAPATCATRWRNPANTGDNIHDLLTEVGLGQFTSHVFRRTFINRMARTPGVTIAQVAEWVGHTQSSMTEDFYLDREPTDAEDTINRAMGY